ncbi:MAG: 5'(3')-deoxyribonucleotidase [Saprospiraceae bacterium]
MKTIAIDMDEVIADIIRKFQDLFEAAHGRRLTDAELDGKKVYQIPEAMEIRKELFKKGFFRDLELIPGALEGVEFLRKHYKIYFVTAAMEFRNSFEDKYDWLFEHLPWVDWKHIVFCGDKSIIATDYLLDDHAKNLSTFSGTPLLFDALHNRAETRFRRLTGWNEVIQFFQAELESER